MKLLRADHVHPPRRRHGAPAALLLAAILLGATAAPRAEETLPGSPTGRSPAMPPSARESQAGAAPPESAKAGLPAQPFLASDLIGHDLLGADGTSLGQITDLVVTQAPTGETGITHLVVQVGGVMGVGGKQVLLAVPSLHVAAGRPLKVDLTAAGLYELPAVAEDRLVHPAPDREEPAASAR